jgi:hypothetical protein
MLVGLAFAMVIPLSAQAQGIPGGAKHGFHEGSRIAGPIGAVVGGAVGGVIGGIEGALGIPPHYATYSDEMSPAYGPRRSKAKPSRRARSAYGVPR